MIFDALRKIAENWLTDIKPLVDAATLLHVPVTPHQVLPRSQDLETISKSATCFRLPHIVTAVEDNASCIVLADPKPNLVGLDEHRMFIECIPADADEANYNDTPDDRSAREAFKAGCPRGVYVVSAGSISSPAQRAGSFLAAGELLWVVRGTIKSQHTTAADFNALPAVAIDALTHSALRNAMTAIEELIALQSGSVRA